MPLDVQILGNTLRKPEIDNPRGGTQVPILQDMCVPGKQGFRYCIGTGRFARPLPKGGN